MTSASTLTSQCVGYPGKRTLDWVGALALIVLTAPVMLGVALAIRWGSPGPVLFRQRRIGLAGQPFECLKFRTMTHGSSDEAHREFTKRWMTPPSTDDSQTVETTRAPSAASSPPLYKLHEDRRVTPIGRWLRRTSLDELPQLFNILQGHMSLVGPRPALPYEVEQYQPWHTTRFSRAKPGLTGWWQVYGRGQVCFDEMVRMDLLYLQRCSLATDLRLLWLTAGVVCRGVGAA